MKINEIIKQKRIEKGLTQEQVANYLGVSTPAVSKWESAITYPDITLLPTLARILDTDLNTLLDFKEDLNNHEITLFMNQVSDTILNNGFEQGYNLAMNKIKEFPNCDLLISNIAILLDGASMLTKEKINEQHQKEIEKLLKHTNNEQSQSILISKLIQKGEYDKAQQQIDSFKKTSYTDYQKLQSDLYFSKGDYFNAARIIEEKILSNTSYLQSYLLRLMEIALKERRLEDALYIADVSKKAAQLFDLWEYNSYVAHHELYSKTKNKKEYIKTLIPMLKSLTKKWNINNSPLYRHIKTKEIDQDFPKQLQKLIIQSLDKNDQELLNSNADFKDIITKIN